MMRSIAAVIVITCLLAFSGTAHAQRQWIIENYQLQDGPFYEVVGGGYNGANYHWSNVASIQRAYWRFNFPDVPSRPALYFVEQWVPSVKPAGVTSWNWLPIEVTFNGEGSGEEATMNSNIPWDGAYGTNHQWLGMGLGGAAGTWQQAGPGPQAPANATCGAGASGQHMWMRKGSTLYTKWLFPFTSTHAITALRITEVFPTDLPPVCDTPVLGSPMDLRCVGNCDPLYAGDELYGNGNEASVDGNSFAAEGYVAPNCFTTFDPLSPGLPADGLFTAHLPDADVEFKFRFDGMNSLKWRDDDSGTYARSNIYTLNGTAGREFVEGRYGRLYLASVKSSGNNGSLRVEAVYTDDSTEATVLNLYDWFNNDGDDASLAIGTNGQPRRSSTEVFGFRRVGSNAAPDGGGDHGGAFIFVHTVELNKSKILKQIRLGIEDQVNYNGELVVLGASLALGCNSPVFDVASSSGDATGIDGAVDHMDFAVFQACYTGSDPGPGQFDSYWCSCLDFDGDKDIDGDDYTAFEGCASGPGILADPACDD